MAYSYDRTRTAKFDVFAKWQLIVSRHEKAEQKELDALLKAMVGPMVTVGYDLDVRKSHLGKDYHGSDGLRMSGELHVTERPENIGKAETARQVSKWVEIATGLYNSPRRVAEGVWAVDISDS